MDGITNSSSMTWDMVDMSCIGRRHSAGASNIYQNFSMEFASEIFLITGLYEFSIGVNMEARFGTALMSMCENVKLRSETWHCEGVKQWNGWISKVSCMVTVFKVNKFVDLGVDIDSWRYYPCAFYNWYLHKHRHHLYILFYDIANILISNMNTNK